MSTDAYEVIIGLEVHVQLKTRTKLFCGCSTVFGAEPNTQTCPVCLGHPGVLPVLNREAFRMAVKTALAFGCTVAEYTKFDRKHYYYPDLPKNYQISQYDTPFAVGGRVEFMLDGERRAVRLVRIHLEEDAGKLVHDEKRGVSFVDLNRAGIPLLEIVSEPDIRSPREAYAYLVSLKRTLEYLEVSDCNMEEGSLRCDANVNIRVGDDYTPVAEVKNLNSFRGVESALAYEAERHYREYLKTGLTKRDTPKITVGWDADKGVTVVQREKEEAHDYRYFPEPDIPPVVVSREYVEEVRRTIGELPLARRERFMRELGLGEYDADVLTQEKALADYFERTCAAAKAGVKRCANFVINDVLRAVNERGIPVEEFPVPPEELARLVEFVEQGRISNSVARDKVFPEMVAAGKSADEVIREKNLERVSDVSALEEVVSRVVEANPRAVEDYRAGKKKAIGFLMGQVMRETKGRADHAVVMKLLESRLGGES